MTNPSALPPPPPPPPLPSSKRVLHTSAPPKNKETSSTSSGTTSTKTKLRTVVGDGASFQQLMKERTKIRKEKDEHSVAELRIQLLSMEDALSAEMKRRIETTKTIQTQCDDKIASLKSHFDNKMEEKMNFVTERITSLEGIVSDLEGRLNEVRDIVPKDINKKGKELKDTVAQFREELEREKNDRSKREALLSKQLVDFKATMETELEQEKIERKSSVKMLREMVSRNESGQKEADDKFEKLIEMELSSLKEEIKVEAKERKMEDDQIVEALNRYTENLEASLSMISSLED